MVSAIIITEGETFGVDRLMGSLVPAVVAGVLRDVVLIVPEITRDLERISDEAGCALLVATDETCRDVVTQNARSDWFLLLSPKTVLEEGWFREVDAFLKRVENTNSSRDHYAVFQYAVEDFDMGARRREFWAWLIFSLFGKLQDRQATLLSRRTFEQLRSAAGMAKTTRQLKRRQAFRFRAKVVETT